MRPRSCGPLSLRPRACRCRGADRLGFTGAAAAQETIDIDTFYDELDPYGEWVWHPRYGYVWLPEDVSPRWRPYTVGRWTYTDEYGWYWDSNEPFAWAVYHYGRWGYDEDYGWFWVPGDTWAPAWVQWRYSDDYVGWAPVGPGRRGYAYGVPVNYEPPIAESWVFVQPRYMTSRVISHYALPIGGLGVAFFGATNVYRPIYRGGIVYNYGMPRDRVVKIIRRPIYVQKVYKVDHWKGGKYDRDGRNKGIKIYAPHFNKDGRNCGPKKFVDNPKDFKPKAKLHDTFKGDVPKGWGKSAKGLTPIAKEDPEGFKKKGRFDGHDQDFGDRGKDKDRDKDRSGARTDQRPRAAVPPINKVDPVTRIAGKVARSETTGDQVTATDSDKDKDKSKGQASKDFDRDGKQGRKGKDGSASTAAWPPPIVKGAPRGEIHTRARLAARRPRRRRRPTRTRTRNKTSPGPRSVQAGQARRRSGRRSRSRRPSAKSRPRRRAVAAAEAEDLRRSRRSAAAAGGQRWRPSRAPQGNQGGGGGGGGDKKCQKHPEKPECQGRTRSCSALLAEAATQRQRRLAQANRLSF